jgi:nondiscriminating glutamyl-tRNA synthetase
MIKAKTGLKGKNLFMPVRALLTSVLHGPDLAEMLKLIGFEKIKMRINSAYEKNCV